MDDKEVYQLASSSEFLPLTFDIQLGDGAVAGRNVEYCLPE